MVAQISYRLFVPLTPIFEAMGGLALLALVANGTCLALLWRHRSDDVNMSSVFECSRNDIASNVAIILTSSSRLRLLRYLLMSAGRVLLRGSRELSAKPKSVVLQPMKFIPPLIAEVRRTERRLSANCSNDCYWPEAARSAIA